MRSLWMPTLSMMRHGRHSVRVVWASASHSLRLVECSSSIISNESWWLRHLDEQCGQSSISIRGSVGEQADDSRLTLRVSRWPIAFVYGCALYSKIWQPRKRWGESNCWKESVWEKGDLALRSHAPRTTHECKIWLIRSQAAHAICGMRFFFT